MSRIMADAHTVGKNLKYDLNENGSYFSVTPRSSFRSVGSRRLDDFDDDEENAKSWKGRLKNFVKERLFLIVVTCAALIGAIFLVALGLNAQRYHMNREKNLLSPSQTGPVSYETQTAIQSHPGAQPQSIIAPKQGIAQFPVNSLEPVGQLREITHCEEPEGLQLYPHPKYCDQFFKCANGTLTLETCENGLLFGGQGSVYNHCDYHWAVDCGTRSKDIIEIRTGGCKYRFGIFPRTDSCDTYFYRCKFGIREDVPCTKGLAYDDRIHQCNWPDLTPGCDPEEIVNFQCPDKLPSGSFARKFLPFPRFPSDDCYSLIVCVNGYPRRVGCEKGKVFDEVTLSCEHPENVRGRCAGQAGL